jgi:hypothetical protein
VEIAVYISYLQFTLPRWYRISRPIRCTVIFLLEILEKNNEYILILVIYWKKTGLLHTKISNHNIIMPDLMIWKQITLSHDKDIV